MFFTREDINKIYQALLKLGIKDSELPETSDVKNDDTLAIIQDGKNKQINVREFLNQISLWKREDFINITDKYKKSHITLVEAIQAIPIVQRKEGLVITFLDTENNWRIYQFRGSLLQFNNETLWVELIENNIEIKRKGTTEERPILLDNNEGFEYYDSTLKKKILWNGIKWTNIDGTLL